MNKIMILLLCFFAQRGLAVAQENTQINIGLKDQLYSNVLNEDREYWVSLPESYDEEGASYKRYPILIVLDGHIHFQYINGVVSYMSSTYNGNMRIPEMIVVALQNVNRQRDFTPDKIITKRENDTGGGENFLRFLETELIPALDNKYRTAPYRILFGHSLGGLIATHAYMKEQTLFNAFIAADPSFGTWDVETMAKKIEAVTDQSFDRYLYIATANWGKRNVNNRDRHVRLYESLYSKCKGEFNARLEYFEDENHISVPPIAFYNGISAIFNGYGVYYRDIDNAEQLVQHFEKLSNRLSWKVIPPEALVNRIGYYLMQSGSEEALEMFILNTMLYPQSYNAFDSLGEAYLANGDTELAKSNYAKSLELNPNNENAKEALRQLEK